MTRYERRVLAVDDDGVVDFEGRIVAVLDSPKAGKRQITAIVEMDSEPPVSTFTDDSQGVDTPKKATFFCNEEKADGEPCEREVDQPNDTCWQHDG